MSSIDQQFIEYIVKSLVGNPEAVIVDRRIDEKGVLLELTVDPDDLGRVIGKRGATAQSLRTLLRALGTKNDARYNLKIVDNGVNDSSQADGVDNTMGDEGTVQDNTQQPQQRSSQDDSTRARQSDDDDDLFSSGSSSGFGRSNADTEDSRVSKTRRELEELDDLDV